MEAIYHNDICELLTEADKFCNNIDRYATALGISERKIIAFKNDVRLLKHIISHEDSFSADFISYTTIALQGTLTALVVDCTLSKKYTQKIGDALGIQIPLYNTAGLRTDFKIKWGKPITDLRDLPGTRLVNL